MLKTVSIPRGGKRRPVVAGRHVTERLAGYKREVARLSEETRGQQRLLEALLLPRVQLQHAGPFKLPSHLLHCSSNSVGVSVDPEGPGPGPGPGELSKCTQTKVKEELEDHEIRDHDDEAGDRRAAGEPPENADSDLQSGHLEEIRDDASSGIETEDSEDGDSDCYPREPCKLTPQTQGEKSKKAQEGGGGGGGGVVVGVWNGGRETVAQSDWRLQRCRPTPCSCKVCPASFPNGKLFLWHIREHKQACAWCGLHVRATQLLKAHLQTHTQCPVCGKNFRSFKNLKQHIRNYVRGKHLGCAECGKQFQKRQNLERHAKCHTGEKPLSCAECGKRFTERYLLDRHMRTHTGEKPFSCAVCHGRFTQKGSMMKHMKRHITSGTMYDWPPPAESRNTFHTTAN